MSDFLFQALYNMNMQDLTANFIVYWKDKEPEYIGATVFGYRVKGFKTMDDALLFKLKSQDDCSIHNNLSYVNGLRLRLQREAREEREREREAETREA